MLKTEYCSSRGPTSGDSTTHMTRSRQGIDASASVGTCTHVRTATKKHTDLKN